MKTVDFYIVDVFAQEKYTGNQLAVFVDLEQELSSEQMLQMTREINFAESTFITAINDDGSYTVRIFTTEYEVPFAGHPTLGTAYVIAKYLTDKPKQELVLHLKKGNIVVAINEPLSVENSRFTMLQAQPEFGAIYKHSVVADCLDINCNDFEVSQPIQEISTGLPYLIIFLKDLKAIQNLSFNYQKLESFLKKHKLHKSNSATGLSTSFFFVTEETIHAKNHYHTRMFVLEDEKVWEDAATGSANGCFLAYLLNQKSTPISVTVEQGFEMERNAILYLDGDIQNSNYMLKVGGQVVSIGEGKWNI